MTAGAAPRAFRTREACRAWLERNHATGRELVLRCFKVHAKHRGIGYREGLDEGLCFGWIDGIRRALDKDSFTVRFTPRKPRSIWSRVNIKRFKELVAEKRVRPAGFAAFRKWDQKAAPYSFQSKPVKLSTTYLKRLRANWAAWAFFSAQAPWYRRTVSFFVMSAKRPETRDSRFALVLECSARGRRIPQLARNR